MEQVFADLEGSELAHLPSGKFTANAAWLTLAAGACNLIAPPDTLPLSSTPRRGPAPSAAT
ncbi:hypothetical protein ACFXJ6_39825 [Streptomyces sp. NPDC059218]|uniref:hypothetical protein n=1 Tax=unclassified Streptomyces TaxID=2593676 RepID=UPI003697F04A